MDDVLLIILFNLACLFRDLFPGRLPMTLFRFIDLAHAMNNEVIADWIQLVLTVSDTVEVASIPCVYEREPSIRRQPEPRNLEISLNVGGGDLGLSIGQRC